MTTNIRKSKVRKSTAHEGTPFAEDPTPIWIKNGSWLIIPLGLLAALCLYSIVRSVPGWGYLTTSPSSIFAEPALVAFLIVPFILLYGYKALRRMSVPRLARVTAYILVALFTLFAFSIIIQLVQPCTGFGGRTECSVEYNLFNFWIIFFNPLSAFVLSFLSVASIVALLVKSK